MKQLADLHEHYVQVEEIATLWGVTPRRVQAMCAAGKLKGAIQVGRSWLIPRDLPKPADGRTKAARTNTDADMPLPRKSPFIYMSDLYSVPGTADQVGDSLLYHHEAQVLFETEVAYSRGQIDKVYDSANYLLHKHSGFYAVLSAGMLLAQCAIWKGDIVMWRRAKNHIAAAPAKNDNDLDMMQLAISAVDIMIYSADSFPEWFKMGCFEPVHPDAFPAAKVYYAKYLYACAYGIATGAYQMEGMQGLSMMRMVPNMVEPMICWASANKTIMSEIYLRMTCAAAYHNCGNDARAIMHIDRALTLALQDKLYGTIAEYCRVLDTLVLQRLAVLDPQAAMEVERLYRIYNQGWSKLSGAVRGKNIITTLSAKEREVAKLAAFGMSNQQIADKMHMSLSVVKQAIRVVSEKSGMSRSEFAAIL